MMTWAKNKKKISNEKKFSLRTQKKVNFFFSFVVPLLWAYFPNLVLFIKEKTCWRNTWMVPYWLHPPQRVDIRYVLISYNRDIFKVLKFESILNQNSKHWYFAHVYINQLFSVEATKCKNCKNSNFGFGFPVKIWKKQPQK